LPAGLLVSLASVWLSVGAPAVSVVLPVSVLVGVVPGVPDSGDVAPVAFGVSASAAAGLAVSDSVWVVGSVVVEASVFSDVVAANGVAANGNPDRMAPGRACSPAMRAPGRALIPLMMVAGSVLRFCNAAIAVLIAVVMSTGIFAVVPLKKVALIALMPLMMAFGAAIRVLTIGRSVWL